MESRAPTALDICRAQRDSAISQLQDTLIELTLLRGQLAELSNAQSLIEPQPETKST